MKNFLESLAIFLVGILSVGIIYLIIQYNMIQDENMLNDVLTELAEPVEESGKTQEENYLENLEGYDDDDLDLGDEELDVTKESTTNTVTVVAEVAESALDDAVEDKSKSSYMENLESYQEVVPANENVDVTKESLTNTVTVEADEKSALEEVVEDKSKASYTENLEKYKDVEPTVEETPAEDASGEPQKLEHDEIVDEVGMAIDAALEDL